MTLLELKNLIGRKGLDALAVKIGMSCEYLSQCARDDRYRKPGEDVCRALVKADSRLTLAELRPDIFGAERPSYTDPSIGLLHFGAKDRKRA